MPLMEAGPIIEVSVSVPKDKGTMLAETATLEPELDPSTAIRIIDSHHGKLKYILGDLDKS